MISRHIYNIAQMSPAAKAPPRRLQSPQRKFCGLITLCSDLKQISKRTNDGSFAFIVINGYIFYIKKYTIIFSKCQQWRIIILRQNRQSIWLKYITWRRDHTLKYVGAKALLRRLQPSQRDSARLSRFAPTQIGGYTNGTIDSLFFKGR